MADEKVVVHWDCGDRPTIDDAGDLVPAVACGAARGTVASDADSDNATCAECHRIWDVLVNADLDQPDVP